MAVDDAGWVQATLTQVYLQGWSSDPNIADGFVALYKLAGNQTFRYVSVTWGGPGAHLRDGDNEIDAVGGLTAAGGGVGGVPEPGTWALLSGGPGLLASMSRYRRLRG